MAKPHQFSTLFSTTANKVIGIMGGSFNPAHDGHNHVADMATRALGLDELWWLVSPQNPLKVKDSMASYNFRLNAALSMAETCTHAHVMKISSLEQNLGSTLSYQTLVRIRQHTRRAKLIWIMGGDNLLNFHRWNRPDVISKTMAIAVVNRPGSRHLRSSQGAKIAGTSLTPRQMRAHGFPKRHWCYIQGRLNSQSATAIRAKKLD